ncbi:HTH_Tnp_Tc3_2 domain-containing protein [Trichonephila clavipes]|nr:HTH_Tnp_Tc3_2 domain-containing protein [Trichonephila clavipes]
MRQKAKCAMRILVAQLGEFKSMSLREAGWSNRRIGRHLGQSDMVVARCWQQWITEGRVYRRGGSGRPRNTNDREDRAIRRVATSAPTTSLASIQRHLPPSRHPVPSRETIRRRLTEVGLRSRRPLRRLPLTPHHRQCRLDFCRPRAAWSVTDWRRVIFSDESRFSLSADDHRTRVWRRTGQRSDPAFIVERHTAISQGVTVWGAISWDTRSSLSGPSRHFDSSRIRGRYFNADCATHAIKSPRCHLSTG